MGHKGMPVSVILAMARAVSLATRMIRSMTAQDIAPYTASIWTRILMVNDH